RATSSRIASAARRGVFDGVRDERRPAGAAHAHTESGACGCEAIASDISSRVVVRVTLHPHGYGTKSITTSVRAGGKGLPLHRTVAGHVSRAVVGNAVVRTATGVVAGSADIVRVESRTGPIRDRIRSRR